MVDQGVCGSCWAVSLAGAISDRYMISNYINYIQQHPQGQDFPHFKSSNSCEDSAYNYKYMASPTDLLRNMSPETGMSTQVPGWQCCGGTPDLTYAMDWANDTEGTFDWKIVDILKNGKLKNMAACPYNDGNWFDKCSPGKTVGCPRMQHPCVKTYQ